MDLYESEIESYLVLAYNYMVSNDINCLTLTATYLNKFAICFCVVFGIMFPSVKNGNNWSTAVPNEVSWKQIRRQKQHQTGSLKGFHNH